MVGRGVVENTLLLVPEELGDGVKEGVSLEDVERQLVVQALTRCHGNLTRAGLLLGINRDQMRYRIEKFGLVKPGPVAARAADVTPATA